MSHENVEIVRAALPTRSGSSVFPRFLGRRGIEGTARVALVWTIRDRSVVRICLYQQTRDTLEAAGLKE